MPFRSALSGLNASSSELRVIGNNVANANTTGFKKSRTEFADIYAVSNLGVSSNAIGNGVRVANVSQQFTQGNTEFTDNNLDLAINGRGFFVLSDSGSFSYTRAGEFKVDRDGYIVNNQSFRLQGYQVDSLGNITASTGDLRLDNSNIAPAATTTIEVGLNLDATETQPIVAFDPTDPTSYSSTTSLTAYDSLGSAHQVSMYYVKTANPNEWDTYVFVDGNDVYGTAPLYTSDVLLFDGVGQLSQVNGVAVPPGSVTYPAYDPLNGANVMNLTLDYTAGSPTTQYGSTFGVNALTQDGYSTGRLNGVDIDETGIVQARYTNGQSRTLGQVVLSDFANAQGLRAAGDTSWLETFSSGNPLIGAAGSSSLGLINSGALEGSNVDLTEQLVNMITSQRNFQANSQVISTADAITQTIINIR